MLGFFRILWEINIQSLVHIFNEAITFGGFVHNNSNYFKNWNAYRETMSTVFFILDSRILRVLFGAIRMAESGLYFITLVICSRL